MALQHNVTLSSGVVATEAYTKIGRVDRLDKTKAMFSVECYLNAEARNTGKTPLCGGTFEMDVVDGDISWTAIYNYLKTLPEYENALDV